MPLTPNDVLDRLCTVIAAQGFGRTLSAFDFDQQPDTHLQRTFYVTWERESGLEYLGGQTSENYELDCYVALLARRDAWGAARQLKVDLDVIEAAILNDYPVYEYCVLDEPPLINEVPPPDLNVDFVVGRLTCVITFD